MLDLQRLYNELLKHHFRHRNTEFSPTAETVAIVGMKWGNATEQSPDKLARDRGSQRATMAYRQIGDTAMVFPTAECYVSYVFKLICLSHIRFFMS